MDLIITGMHHWVGIELYFKDFRLNIEVSNINTRSYIVVVGLLRASFLKNDAGIPLHLPLPDFNSKHNSNPV